MFPGMNSGYMTYLVSTTSSLPDFPRSGVSVRRRFRDFVVRPPVTSRLCVVSIPADQTSCAWADCHVPQHQHCLHVTCGCSTSVCLARVGVARHDQPTGQSTSEPTHAAHGGLGGVAGACRLVASHSPGLLCASAAREKPRGGPAGSAQLHRAAPHGHGALSAAAGQPSCSRRQPGKHVPQDKARATLRPACLSSAGCLRTLSDTQVPSCCCCMGGLAGASLAGSLSSFMVVQSCACSAEQQGGCLPELCRAHLERSRARGSTIRPWTGH